MDQKVILITGTNSGFGWLTATTCAALGHKVYATMRAINGRNAEKAKTLTQQANIQLLEMDLTDGAAVTEAVATIMQREGRLDVVVNNAGVYATGITETFTADDFHQVLDVNVNGAWRVMRAALPHMRQQGAGLIINISSTVGRFASPFVAIYSSAKYALEGLSEGLHYEVRPLGVDVVVLQPGSFPTDLFGKIVSGSDASVVAGYGAMAQVPAQIEAGIKHLFEAVKPDPQLVADAVIKLIGLPKGQRPLRTVVDPVTGTIVETANTQVAQQYEQFLTAFGMQELLN
jgi:NAD(P)-dependent dehydrogenase (short-subunit alcohol dehydrogenase family)